MVKAPAKTAAKAAPKTPAKANATDQTATASAATTTAAQPSAAPGSDSSGSGGSGQALDGQGDFAASGAVESLAKGQLATDQAATQQDEAAALLALGRRQRPDPTKRAYVVGSVPIRHDGEFYDVGYEIELTIAEADRLSGLVVPLPNGGE